MASPTRILAFRALDVKFSQPVYPDDTIHVEMSVVETKPMRRLNAERVLLKFSVFSDNITIKNKVVQLGSWVLLIRNNNEL